MRRKRVLILLVMVLFIISSQITAYASTATYDDGLYSYASTTTPIAASVLPIYETQTEHDQGVAATTITVQTSYTKSLSASSSISLGGSVFGVTLATQLGITQTESYTVTAGVSYTIPISNPTGWYRIETVFPDYQVQNNKWRDSDGRLMFSQTIQVVPQKNASYKRLRQYI